MNQTTQQSSGPFYIGIDFHKHYSVFCIIDDRNTILERGRIDHTCCLRDNIGHRLGRVDFFKKKLLPFENLATIVGLPPFNFSPP